jgi:hypothetical protein
MRLKVFKNYLNSFKLTAVGKIFIKEVTPKVKNLGVLNKGKD